MKWKILIFLDALRSKSSEKDKLQKDMLFIKEKNIFLGCMLLL